MIFLVGRERRALEFELSHDVVCDALGKCTCQDKTVHVLELNKHTGEKKMVEKTVKAPRTITIFFKRRSRVDEPVLKVPAIQAAISARRIRVVRTP